MIPLSITWWGDGAWVTQHVDVSYWRWCEGESPKKECKRCRRYKRKKYSCQRIALWLLGIDTGLSDVVVCVREQVHPEQERPILMSGPMVEP